MEKAREAALEVAQEEDAPAKARPEDAQAIGRAAVPRVRNRLLRAGAPERRTGVWGNTVSSRAPVTGVIANGFAD